MRQSGGQLSDRKAAVLLRFGLHLLRHLLIKCIILPRQARDIHRENSNKEWRQVPSACRWVVLGGVTYVVELADAVGGVAMQLEPLRPGTPGLGTRRVPPAADEVPHLRRVRAAAGEQGRARGPADGLVAVGVVEGDALRREAVDVRHAGLV
eukprot:COSAG06_NODE_11654_length_1481_cov_1.022431_1_plen_151_part_10